VEEIINKLLSAGWDADLGDSTEESLEAFVHEIAHNMILGDMTPKGMAGTDNLIKTLTPGSLGDADEILATAVTIQVLETYFGVLSTTTNSLWAVSMNVKGKAATLTAADQVIELIGTDRVNKLSREMYDYIQSL
jgi:hypothetical protein